MPPGALSGPDGRSLPVAGHGAAAEVAHAHRNDNGNVSDEWVIRLYGSPTRFAPPAGRKMSLYYLPKLEPVLQPLLL